MRRLATQEGLGGIIKTNNKYISNFPKEDEKWGKRMTDIDMDLSSGIAAFEAKYFTKAFQLLSPLAGQGEAGSQYRLAIMYQNGLGCAKNEEKAYEMMKTAANQGHALAQHGLGFMYMHGECAEKDESRAAKWFTSAAEQGLAGSQMTLGMMYEQGLGVEQDTVKSQHWYKQAESIQ